MKETLPSFWTRAMASIEHDEPDVRRRAMILRWACIVFVLLVVLGNLTSVFMLSEFMLGVTIMMNSLFAIVCVVVIRRTRQGHVDLEGGAGARARHAEHVRVSLDRRRR